MVVNTGVAQIPVPQRTDRIDGPGSFTLMARRLDDIVVVAYADIAARTAAYLAQGRSPVEGSLSYLANTNVFEYYTGTAWLPNVPDDWARGVLSYSYLDTTWPSGTQTYQASGTEGMIPGTAKTVELTLNRIYRVSFHVATMDGGPSSSTTSGCGVLNIRYNSSATPATTSSTLFSYSRVTITSDFSTNSDSGQVTRVWKCPVSGLYSFGVSLYAQSTTGARLIGPQAYVIEDLGKTKLVAGQVSSDV